MGKVCKVLSVNLEYFFFLNEKKSIFICFDVGLIDFYLICK